MNKLCIALESCRFLKVSVNISKIRSQQLSLPSHITVGFRQNQNFRVTTMASASTSSGKGNPSKAVRFAKQDFDYFLVLDFEATCEDGRDIYPQEIIELPVLKVNAKTFETEAEFHTYVQPTYNKQLSEFCTKLTGITQSMVDGQPTFKESLEMLDDWMLKENLLNTKTSFIFVTCGDWDFRKQLTNQCGYYKVDFPHYCKRWINIKKSFAAATGVYHKGLPGMLGHLNLSLDGRHHSGIDDSKNIAKILQEIGKTGFVFKSTGYL